MFVSILPLRLLLPALLSLLFFHFADSSSRCPARCYCTHSAVICTGLGLTQVPKDIPPDTSRLDLQENRIQVIHAEDFAGLGKLRVLLLGDNLIETIEPEAFRHLPRLERIRLGRNRLRTLPDGLFAGNQLMKRLDLSENALWSLSNEQLAGPEHLVSLQLDRNQLQCLDSLALNRWPSLESLSISSNALSSLAELDLVSLPQLRTLRLSDNPWHCDCRLRWLRRLKVANQIRCHRPSMLYGRSLDTVSSKQLKCSGLEKRASGQRRACRDVDLCPPGCACTEAAPDAMVVDCHDRQLRAVPTRLPPNVVELRLGQNRLTRLDNNSFAHVPRLVRLDLSKNGIFHVDAQAFAGLPRLSSLMLFANNLTDLPVGLFQGLASLQVLLLNGNRLQCLRNGLFDGLSQLRLLSLYDNQIRAIDEQTLGPLIGQALQTLHLAKNPLICDCNLAWLGRALERRPIETSGARCHSPARLARRRIAALSADRFRCHGSAERLVTEGAGQCRIDRECPEPCQCEGTTMDCSNRQLATPPQAIPLYVTRLLLAGNRITSLPALGPLPNLQFLDLSSNRIHSLDSNSLAGLDALRELDLRNNGLRRFGMGHAVISLETLHLDGNSLGCLSLVQLPALRRLSLRQNPKLLSLGPFNNKRLEHIELDDTGQWLCDCHLRGLVQLLKKGSSNRTTVQDEEEQEQAKCAEPAHLRGRLLAELEEHDLPLLSDCTASLGQQQPVGNNNGGHCAADGLFCPRGCVCSSADGNEQQPMLVVRCSNLSLTKLPWGLPEHTTELLLDHNRIERIVPEQFAALSQLSKLDLSHNRLRHVPSKAFALVPSLASMVLAHNQIGCLADDAFHGLGRLRLLSLHDNQLAQLPEAAFAPLLANLSHVALGANPLWCDCAMSWAVRWLRSKFVEPGIARCDGPPERRQKLLISAADPLLCSVVSSPPSTTPDWVLAKCQPCLLRPCLHSAQCYAQPAEGGGGAQFRCDCPPGWHGPICELPVDTCFGQPCQNGGTCQKKMTDEEEDEGRFQCICAPGFGGERCERERDECLEAGGNSRCVNGGTCRDELNGFRCECPPGWLGRHCELHICSQQPAPPNCSLNIDPETMAGQQQCSSQEKAEGQCADSMEQHFEALEYEQRAPPLIRAERAHTESPVALMPTETNSSQQLLSAQDCAPDFGGPNCSRRTAIGLRRPEAFLSLGQWAAEDAEGHRKMELHFRTKQRGGILLWLGGGNSSAAFLLLELVQGRLRAAVQLGQGHSPPSQLFSLSPVNDGQPHRVSLHLHGQRLSLALDSLPVRSILNSGPLAHFPFGPLQLFLGGLPAELGRRALVQFRLSDPSGIRGCFWDIRLNASAAATQTLDLAPFADAASTVDCAHALDCAEEEDCPKNKEKQRKVGRKCARERHGRRLKGSGSSQLWLEPGGKCRSIHPLPGCVGQCQDDGPAGTAGNVASSCCVPVSTKRRRIRLQCVDGSEKWSLAEVPRRCGCASAGDGQCAEEKIPPGTRRR